MRTRTGFAAVVVLSGVAVGAPQVEAQINKEFINPAGGFTQVVTVEDRGVKTVYLSGQVGRGAVSNENPPTSTLVGIDRLVNDRIQIEVDAVAVVEDAGRGERLTTTFLDPAGSFTQVATVQGDGAKTIYVSGQVGRPGEPRETQAQQALAGMRRRLALAGATPADLVKVTYYLPGYTPGNTGISGAREANEFPAENPPAATLLGIQSLYSETALFEYEGIAVVQP